MLEEEKKSKRLSHCKDGMQKAGELCNSSKQDCRGTARKSRDDESRQSIQDKANSELMERHGLQSLPGCLGLQTNTRMREVA